MNKTVKKIFLLLTIIFSASYGFSQQELPFGYKGIQLGMTLDEVKTALKKDGQFGYRGERDVSLLPGQDRVLIETDSSRFAPNSFLERCWFQFYQDKLYIITINVKQKKMDHYSIFSTLMNKYGKPHQMDPEKSLWQDEKIIMTLERPLTLKYTDKKVFDSIQEKSKVDKTIDEKMADDFLNEL